MALTRDENNESVPLAACAVSQVLLQLGDLLEAVSPEDYRAAPEGLPGATSGIGAHVRHCLDHVAALLTGRQRGLIAYDRRQRGTAIETDREAALMLLREQADDLTALTAADLTASVQVETTVVSDRPPVIVDSTLSRELAFVLSHTVHHNAVIGILAARAGYTVPPDFVYAPATKAWMKRDRCAPSP